MESTPAQLSIKELIDLKKSGMLVANAEYQRGSVWSTEQKKRLVDSVLRKYPLPLIYLHKLSVSVAGMTREGLDVIDGQQRTNALFEFGEGAFKLFDPVKDAAVARFPSFLVDQPCPWGGLAFDGLSDELRSQFLHTQLSVVFITTNLPNEARDLFIRLQAGLPLNAQEKRDAWPGGFTDFILKVGGKPEIARYPGHDFFHVAMKTKANNRGEVRQLSAQMYMLFLAHHLEGRFCEIKRDSIDDFYYKHLDFEATGAEPKAFLRILDFLTDVLRDGKRSKIQGYEAISLVLLADSLMSGYAQSWKDRMVPAFDEFRHKAVLGAKTRWDLQPDEYWNRYGVLARTNSDRADTIEKRHAFFATKMAEKIEPKLLDSTRAFGELERELVYYRDRRRCQVKACGGDVKWADAEIHHVVMHAHGGKTLLENGALVHKGCHPRSVSAVAEFAASWESKPLM